MDFFRHQSVCITKALQHRHYALFLDCGLGKTRIAIELIKHRKVKTLVIAPNTILDNWCEEIKKWSSLQYVILKGSRHKRIKLLAQLSDVYIINYEALRILEKELFKARFQFIIADESQKLKGYKSKQSKTAFRLGQTTPYKLLMTGTPIQNNPFDVFGQYRFLNPFIFGFSFYKFRAQFAVMGGFMNYQVMRWMNLDVMQKKIYSCAIRYTKEECLDLPDKLYETVKVTMPKEQGEVYKRLKKNLIADFKGRVITAPMVLTRLIRFSQITAGFTKSAEGEEIQFETNPKIMWLKEFLEDLPKEKKVVVYVRFRKEIKVLEKFLDTMKVKHVTIFGDTKDRQELINRFNTTDIRVFVGQLDTAGVGINLHTAQYCVFLTNGYNYGSRVQCEDRLHRIGQKNKVTYIDVVMDKTIDDTILKCIKKKKSMAEYVVDRDIGGLV